MEDVLKVLEKNNNFGEINDVNKPYVLLEYGFLYMKMVFIADNDNLQRIYKQQNKGERVLLLKNIYIPEKDRQKGYCNR